MGVTFIAKEGTYTAPATLTTKSITENGTYSAVDDSANGFSSVTVNVPLPTGKITITENGTDINIAQYAKADVNVAGGGGSSDLSTAEVTINGDENFSIAMAVCNSQAPFDGLHIVTDLGEGGNYTTPLYKGKEYVVIRAEGEIALSGNIALVDVESSLYLITGDCTITIS